MNELLQKILVLAGGGSVVFVAIRMLVKSLVGHFLSRELESHRALLKFESDKQIESLKAELQRDAKSEDREYQSRQVMKRYEGPLLHAAYDLQSRLYNIIRNQFFSVYFQRGTEEQKCYAELNTAFLIAQFLGWSEIIRNEIQFIETGELTRTRALSELRDEIYGIWQTDKYSDPLMIWAGEQRAIGELMMETRKEEVVCKGYASFLGSFRDAQEPLINHLIKAVRLSAALKDAQHDRLIEIQRKLIDLLDLLDPDYIRFPQNRRTKV